MAEAAEIEAPEKTEGGAAAQPEAAPGGANTDQPQPSAEPAAEAAPEGEGNVAPIIVKKIVGGHGGAHGGAWKIALADMMTAMMAFFLLMWLLGATEADKRKSVADFMRASTSHSIVEMGRNSGSGGILGGQSIIDPEAMPAPPRQTAMMERVTPRSEGGPTENSPADKTGSGNLDEEAKRKEAQEQQEQDNFDKLERELKQKLAQSKRFENVKDQVQFTREKDGLRIDIIDKADFSMFGLGTSKLLPKSEALVAEVAAAVAKLDNKLAVRGHTDSIPFGPGDDRSNWSLSAERAESTRAALERRNIPASRFAKIEGVADTMPFNSRDHADPRNRRISVTVLHKN
ncbi:MAG: flagellar motor protein MotB [Betaproteobacteria bacterium]